MDNQWPSFFPEGCPPQDAVSEEWRVYRFYVKKPLTGEDFMSYYQLDPPKWKGNILAYGLSAYLDENVCKNGIRYPAQKRRYAGYACGITYAHTGVVKRTPNTNHPSHITWWFYDGVKPEDFFSVCV